jgi:predicted nucleic acid-binding protein
MSARFFLDTNIFCYVFDAESPAKAKRAAQLIHRAVDSGEGIVSYLVVQEFFNVAFRRFAQPMSKSESEQYLITVLRPLLAVHSSPSLFLAGLRIAEKYATSWYDSLIVAAALEGGCEKLYSEDLQHGQKIEGLKIENPFL